MLTSLADVNPNLLAGSQSLPAAAERPKDDRHARETFDKFVGQTFFGQLIGSMRKTVDKPAYLHGGRAEEIFRGQLDQTMAEDMTRRTAGDFSGPMYELCMLPRP